MKDNIFLKHYPTLDIHGETEATADLLIKTFINDNYHLKNEYIVIIHGIGAGVLKNKTHEILASDKKVASFKLDDWNLGCTIIRLTL